MTSQYLRSTFSSLREYLTPINHKSTFATTGEITPEEFVQAGDYLVYRFPTWQWSPADKSKSKDFLPHDKQFLVTRHVPCYVRAADYEFLGDDDDATRNQSKDQEIKIGDDDDEEWEAPAAPSSPVISTSESRDIDETSIKEVSDDEDIQDIDELIDENAEDVEFVDNKIVNQSGKDSNDESSKKRSYDLYITYSTSYRVPKMYLVGFDSNSVPLSPEQMFEDIASDYRHKTVTIEKAPFLSNTTSVSIHPCKHANVMKVLMKRAAISARERSQEDDSKKVMKKISKLGLKDEQHQQHQQDDNEDWEDLKTADDDNENENDKYGIRVDQYLIVFLKFISSVIPGIEHDYTMEAL